MAKRTPRQIPAWLLAVGMSVTLIGGGIVGYGVHASLQTIQGNTVPKDFNQAVATYNTITANYYQPTDKKKLVNGAIAGMLNSLDDPYSTYLTNSGKTALDDTLSASFGGIGATLQQQDGQLTIQSLLEDTPAKKAGLKVGDQVVAVDGESVAKLDVGEAVSKIRGKIGTTVKVTVKRQDSERTYALKRAKITTDTVTGKLDASNKQVGFITIATFSDPTAKQFERTVKKLRKQGAKRFVLDLRGNPGGELDQALKIASMALKNGQTIVQVEDRNGEKQRYEAGREFDGGFKLNAKLSVVIDQDSASASEILAAALNENLKAPLVGVKSYGKGTVQNIAPLSDTADLKLTVGKWLTPKGTWINKKGLTPTLKVAYPAYVNSPLISTETLKPGATGDDVKTLQQMLAAVGSFKAEASGTYDAVTEAAVKAFQAAHRLPANGVADAATIKAVYQAAAARFQEDDPQLQAAVAALTKD